MSDELTTKLTAEFDGSKAADGMASMATTAEKVSRRIKDAGDGAGKSFDGIGKGAEASSQKAERATKNLIDQIQRTTASLKAGEKGTADYYNEIARMRGASVDALQPYIEQLRKAQTEQDKAADSMQKWNGAADELGKRLGQVGAAIAGGMFFKKFLDETVNAANEQAQLAAVLTSTGEAAGWTQDQLNEMAATMSKASTFSAGEVNQAQTRMLSYSNVIGAQFPRAMQSVIDMAARMGMSVTQSAETIGKALDVPSEGLTALTKQGFRFTEAQKSLAKELEDSGRVAEAQQIIMQGLESSYGGAAAAARDTLGGALSGLKNTINDLMTGSGGSVDGLTSSVNDLSSTLASEETKQSFNTLIELMVNATNVAVRLANAMSLLSKGNIGASLLDGSALNDPQSALVRVESKLQTLRLDREALNKNWVSRLYHFDDIAINKGQITLMEQQREQLLKLLGGGQYGDNAPDQSLWNTEAPKAYGKSIQENTEWLKKYGTAAQKAAIEIKEWEKKLGGELSPSMRSKIIKDYQDKDKENKGAAAQDSAIAGIKARIEAEKELLSRLNQYGSKAEELSEGDKLVLKLQQEIAESTDARTRAGKEAQLVEALRLQSVQNERIALQKNIKEQKEAEAAYHKYVETIAKAADALGDQADRQDAANASFGKSKVAIAELAMEQAKLAAANAQNVGPWTQDQVDALKRLANEHERYVASLKEATYLEFGAKYDEQIKLAREELELQQYGMSLLGVEETRRQKLIAVKQSELKLQKEIRAIEKESYSDNPVQDWIRKQELIAKARLHAETELQTELSRIQEQYINEQVQKYDQIFSQGFADMLNRGKEGWKSFSQSLVTTFKTTVADAIYRMFARPFVVQVVASLAGFVGGGTGGAALQMLGGGGFTGMLGNAYNLISGGLNVAGMGGMGIQWLADFAYKQGAGAVGSMIDGFRYGMADTASWSAATQAAQAGGAQLAGLIAGSVLNGITGYGLSKWLSGGYSAGGWVNTAAGIASMIPGIGPIAGLIGGVFNRMFGRKLKDTGIEGVFGGETGFEGNSYEFYKGGWFRSDKTVRKPLEEATRQGFADQFTGMKESVEAMGESLGLGANLLDGFTYQIKISLKGLSEEDAAKKIKEEFDKLANSMAEAVLTTDEYAKADETRIETLTRLSQSLTTVNEWLKVTGQQLYEVGLAGADMASQLLDAFGGREAFNSVTSNYYEKYFSESEKVENTLRQMGEAFKALGYESVPASRDAIKELINAQDLSTEAGRKAYAALMGLANILDTVYSAAERRAQMEADLETQLMRARGQDAEADARERAKRLKELEEYGERAIQLQKEIWAAEDAKAAANAVKEMVDALNKAAQDARAQALKNLSAATDRELKALTNRRDALNEQRNLVNESLQLITGIFDLVRQNARELYGQIDSVAEMQAREGRDFISQALGAASRTGYLPDKDQLADAIAAARRGIDEAAYVSQAQRDFDALKLAGELSALEAITGQQKSVQERQLDSINKQLESIDKQSGYLRDQLARMQELVAIANGEYDATLTVAQALREIQALVAHVYAPDTSTGETGQGGGKGGVVVVPPVGLDTPVVGGGGGEKFPTPIFDPIAGTLTYPDGSVQHLTQSGIDWHKYLREGGKMLSFDVGTNYVPRDMVAQIHKGERIIPAADNRALMQAINSGGGGNSELVSAINRLEARLAEIENNTADTAHSNRDMSTTITQVTEGGNAMRILDMA